MTLPKSLIALGTLLGSMTAGQATIVGFGQLGGSNATVPANLASNATADGNGFVVTNGATPNIALTWDANWDIHTSTRFTGLEAKTVGGGAWDDEGSIPRVGQLDTANHTIGFSASSGIALVLNSFDFAHTAETTGTTVWDFTLTDSNSVVVWTQTLTLNNTGTGANDGNIVTLTPSFTGTAGTAYTLTFNRTSQTYASDGRHAIDNLSFNQVAVPEPASAAFAGLAGLALLARRRR